MPGYNVEYNSVNGALYQLPRDDGAALELLDIEGRAAYDIGQQHRDTYPGKDPFHTTYRHN